MGRAKIAEESGVISIRLPLDLIKRLDDYAAQLKSSTPGINVTRTDAARAILTRGLSELSAAKKRKTRTSAKKRGSE